jgi:CubicO group peptidase (beta-lactamase class C family)
MAKYWCGLHRSDTISLDNLYTDLNSQEGKMLRYKLYEKAITLVKNNQSFIPIKKLDTLKFASVCIGSSSSNTFTKTLSKYAPFKHFFTSGSEDANFYNTLVKNLASYNTLVVSFHYLNNNPKANFGISNHSLEFLKKLPANKKVIVVVFGNAYALKNFENQDYLICAYEDNDATRKIVPQIIFGAAKAEGKLPITASSKIRFGDGIVTSSLQRLKYTPFPDWYGVDEASLYKIDSIVKVAMEEEKAMPGCHILVARNGAVVYDKSFGRFTYDSLSKKISDTVLFDIASITKVAATLQAAMYLYSLDSTYLYKTLGELVDSLPDDKKPIILQEVFAHQAGFQAFLEHWRKTMDKNELKSLYYSSCKDSIYTMLVAQNLYAVPHLKDSVWKWTLYAPLMNKRDSCYKYRYSDVGFYFIQKVLEKRLGEPLDKFCEKLYKRLGMYRTVFNPLLNGFSMDDCVPTENDKIFRKRIIQGTVHDEGAAMYGGVAGHAGLFSTANDLAILFQMNLQDGFYGGEQFFKPGTVDYFRKRHYMDNRRGLGWDKPELNGGGPTSKWASLKTFGHQGFTGTCVWIDPKYNLIYIFLSNRTYPTVDNKKLITLNVRTTIHDAIYIAVNRSDEKKKLVTTQLF